MSRETRDRLWRDLLKRSVATPNPRPPRVSRWLLSALLFVLVLYLSAKL
jgi:hypothetical protein